MRARWTTRALALFVAALSLATFTAAKDREPGRFYSLKRYAAQVPVDDTTRPPRNLLKLPELRAPLTALLGARYGRLLRTFEREVPIEIVNGMNGSTATAFLVMYGWRGEEKALVLVDLFDRDGALYVGFARGDASEWHSSKGDAERDVSPEVLAKLNH